MIVIVKKIIYLFLVTVIVFSMGYWTGVSGGRKEICDLRVAKGRLDKRVKVIQGELSEIQGRNSAIQSELARSFDYAAEAERRIRAGEEREKRITEYNHQLEAELARSKQFNQSASGSIQDADTRIRSVEDELRRLDEVR